MTCDSCGKQDCITSRHNSQDLCIECENEYLNLEEDYEQDKSTHKV
jgi:hypothetical protein